MSVIFHARAPPSLLLGTLVVMVWVTVLPTVWLPSSLSEPASAPIFLSTVSDLDLMVVTPSVVSLRSMPWILVPMSMGAPSESTTR